MMAAPWQDSPGIYVDLVHFLVKNTFSILIIGEEQ